MDDKAEELAQLVDAKIADLPLEAVIQVVDDLIDNLQIRLEAMRDDLRTQRGEREE